MKTLHQQVIVLLFLVFTLSNVSTAQDSLPFELSCEVNKVQPFIPVSKDQLTKAQTLSDLNNRYESTWIKEYVSVEISATHKGKIKTATNKSHQLSQEQKNLMNLADVGTNISINVLYIPENTLSNNDVKDIRFTFITAPESQTTFVGGQQQLDQYLKKNVLDKVSNSTFKQHQLTAIKFTVNEEGEIKNAHVVESSKDEKVDELLLKTVQNMPCWKPAEYANGTKEKQDFVLTIGDMNSCVVNLLSIGKNLK